MRALRQKPAICFSAARCNMSSKVLPLKSARLAVQVPATDCPCKVRADQVPCQPAADFCADQVPCSTVCFLSLSRTQDPCAALRVLSRAWPDHRPRKISFCPAEAIQLPSNIAGACWPKAQEPSRRIATSLKLFIPQPSRCCTHRLSTWYSARLSARAEPISKRPIFYCAVTTKSAVLEFCPPVRTKM